MMRMAYVGIGRDRRAAICRVSTSDPAALCPPVLHNADVLRPHAAGLVPSTGFYIGTTWYCLAAWRSG